jgi:hypothetical protein
MTDFTIEDKPERWNMTPKAERNRQIVIALSNLRITLEAIAAKWGLTRERVRQIGVRNGVPRRHLRGEDRDKFLRPYREASGVPCCLFCRSEHNVELAVCSHCRVIARNLSVLNSRLRNGKHQDLIQATWIIRHYGFTPDDLALVTNKLTETAEPQAEAVTV